MSPEYSTLAAVVIAAFAGVALESRRLTGRHRQRWLNTLESIGPKYREQVLSKFTPKIQVRIRLELRQRARRTKVPAKSFTSVDWSSFLAATKGATIHDILDVILMAFLFLSMFGGAFTGYFISQHFASVIPLVWELALMIIGLLAALFGYLELHDWMLGRAFCRSIAFKSRTRA